MPPIKSIAVKAAKSKVRRQPALSLDTGAVSVSPRVPSARPASPGRSQPAHRYQVGESLRMTAVGISLQRSPSMCRVVALLPYEGRGAHQYRVQSSTEAFERIVSEGDLARDVPA